jgi:hypothetical protein
MFILGGIVMKRSLEDEIELMRETMMNVAAREGLTADETMELSQQLDLLINQFVGSQSFL